ncbi:MAG: hypothetical protein WBQ94_12175 [Terracidiphilus sp.]
MRVKALVTKLDSRGWSQWQIRDELKRELNIEISQPMVGIYRRKVIEEARASYLKDRKDADTIALNALYEVIREAWRAYDFSLGNAEKSVNEFGFDSEKIGHDDYITSEHLIKRVQTVEGRLPENAFLTTILKAHSQIADILGLVKKEPQVQNNVNVVMGGQEFWAGLVNQIKQSLPSVEQRVIMALEDKGVADGSDGTQS